MDSNRRRWMRAAWIVVAGSCIALGAGGGVASASPDASDSASASQTTQSTEPPAGSASLTAKDADREQDSTDGAEKPTSSVSATTVTVHRDADSASEPADPVASTPAVSAEPDEPAIPATAASTESTPAITTQKAAEATTEHSTPVVTPATPATPADGTPAPESFDAADVAPAEVVAPESVDAADVAVAEVAMNRSAAVPAASAQPARGPGPLASLILNVLSTFGLVPPGPANPATITPVSGAPSTPGVVTGVAVGHAPVSIPVGSSTYTGAADWYFPTQADGSVQAQGVMWLQHGFLGDKSWYSALAQRLSQQTNSVVVVANVPSFPFFTCGGCTLNGVALQEGVGSLFVDPNRTALNSSATAAGYQGALPGKFVLTGHSAGGGLATAAGAFYVDAVPAAENDLLGVVMHDGVSSNGTFANAVGKLNARNIPVYQIAAPPQPWNANGQTTDDLVALSPGQFVGATLANGSHVDSLIGGAPLIDLISSILIRPSPPGNTEAVYTLAGGWINDMYAGRGPTDPLFGTYGAPNQYVVLGQAAAVVLGPPPVVDVDRYLGTWYEVGSVKQFFSIGLVNTKAVYTLNPDGSIGVENTGNYFFANGPQSRIVGAAVPLDASNNRLNVTFFGPASAREPGNYWIVDLAPDYSWAVVSNSTGSSGFLLSRTPTVSDALYRQLLDRASVQGVNGRITRTRQPSAEIGATAA